MALIAPSLLAADFARWGEALQLIKQSGAPMVHVDVMDGHFVSDISVGQPVIKSLRKATDLVLDVHLLIERPERFAQDFLEAGADRLAVHAESTLRLPGLLEFIRARGAKAGVALNPATPTEAVSELLGEFDFLVIMAAEPRLQTHPRDYRPRTIAKIRQVVQAREAGRQHFAIQVEGGGVEFDNEIVQAGADILVAGSNIFLDGDPKARLAEMIRLAASPQVSSV